MKENRYFIYIMLACFLAGIHRGHVAIWQGEDPQPKWILPYSAAMLPEADRAALEHGIPILNREELTRFLEDYCS